MQLLCQSYFKSQKMKYRISAFIFFLFLTSIAYSFHSAPDSQLVFKGVNSKISYTKGRQLSEASFFISNKSSSKIKIFISKVELIRGQSTTELNNLLIKDNQFPQGNSYIYLASEAEKKVRILFEPFILYEGSKYTIRSTITVDGKEYVATSVIELFRQAYSDKNKYKE